MQWSKPTFLTSRLKWISWDVRNVCCFLALIYESGKLQESATIRKIGIVQRGGEVNRLQMLYNLDAIIAEGYRVNCYQATQFRIWATTVLKEMIVKEFVLDDERLKQGTVSAEDAKQKAFAEYDKFKLVQDRDYLSDFDKEIKRLSEKK